MPTAGTAERATTERRAARPGAAGAAGGVCIGCMISGGFRVSFLIPLRKKTWREGPRVEWSEELSGGRESGRGKKKRARWRSSEVDDDDDGGGGSSFFGNWTPPFPFSLAPLSCFSYQSPTRNLSSRSRESYAGGLEERAGNGQGEREQETKRWKKLRRCSRTTAAAAFREEEERCGKHPQRLLIAPFLQSQRHDSDSCRRATISRDREPSSRKRQALREIDY